MKKISKIKLGVIIFSAAFLAVPFFSARAADEYQRPMQIDIPKRELPTQPDTALLTKVVSPPLLIEDSKVDVSGRELKGSFILGNSTDEIFSDASWKLEVYKGKLLEQRWDTKGMYPIGLQYVFVNQPYFTLQPKEKTTQKFDLNLSHYLPAGDYVLRIMAVRRNSNTFGFDEKAFQLSDGKNGYLEIDENSVELVDLAKKNAYPAQYGWRIVLGMDKPQAQLAVKNPSSETVTVTPYFTIWSSGFEKNQKVKEIKMDALSFSAGEEKKFVFDLPIDFSPGSYHAELNFKDNQGDLQAPPQIFHWVLGGNSGTLESLKINTDAFLKNEPIKLAVDAFGRADGLKDDYIVEGKIYDSKGNMIFDEKASINRPALNGNFTVAFPEVKASSDLTASRAEAFLYSKDQKLLDNISIEIKPLSPKAQDIMKSKNKLAKIPYLIFSAITVGIFLLYWLIVLRKNIQK